MLYSRSGLYYVRLYYVLPLSVLTPASSPYLGPSLYPRPQTPNPPWSLENAGSAPDLRKDMNKKRQLCWSVIHGC